MKTDSDQGPAPRDADPQYAETRDALDRQALAWARTARGWMWLSAVLLGVAAAGFVGFLVF